MKRTRPLLAVLAVAALALSACARSKPQGPDTTAAPGADPTFCKGISDFRAATANLTSQTVQADPAQVLGELRVAHDELVTLLDKAPTAGLKADLRIVSDNYDAFIKALTPANGNPQAMIDAATAFKEDPAVTKATDELNAYGHTTCGLNTEVAPTTTVPTTTVPTTTPAGGVGPVAPTTTGGTATTVGAPSTTG